MSEYTTEVLKIVASKICLSVGWNAVSYSCLHILVDIFERYILEIAKMTGHYCTFQGHTEPNISDIILVFKYMAVDIDELEEYLNTERPPPPPISVPEYPVPKETNLNFLRPGSKEIINRPIYVNSYLPPMPEEIDGVAKKPDNKPMENMELVETPEIEKWENECLWKKITDKLPLSSSQTSKVSSVLTTPFWFLPESVEGQLPHNCYPVDTNEASSSLEINRCVIKIPKSVWDKHSISQENSSMQEEPTIAQDTSSKKRTLSDREGEEDNTMIFDKKKIKILRKIHSRVCKKRII